MSEFDNFLKGLGTKNNDPLMGHGSDTAKGSDNQNNQASTEAGSKAGSETENANATATTSTQGGDNKAADTEASTQNNLSTENIESKQPTIDDAAVMSYLAEKHGITSYSSIDLMKGKLGEQAPSYASKEIEQINKYTSETGRPASDFFKMTANYDDLPRDQRIIDYYKSEFPGLSDEHIRVKLQLDLKPLDPESDEFSEDDIASRNREITLRDAELIMIDAKAKKMFEEQKQKYALPSEDFSNNEKALQEWDNGITNAISEFDLGIEGYTYEKNTDVLKSRYKNLESILSTFLMPDGKTLDFKKMVRTIEAGLNADKIASAIAGNSKSSGQKEVLDEMSNTTSGYNQKTVESDQNKKEQMSQANSGILNSIIGLK